MGATLHRGARASHYRSLSLRSTGSRRAGSVIAAHGPSCSAACGILPDQGTNPCPLHRQADSQPLRHQGSPFSFSLLKKKKNSGLLLQGLKEKKTNIVSTTKPFLLPVFIFYSIGLFQINEFEGVPLEYAAGMHSAHSSPKGQSSKFMETRSQWLLGSVYIVREE